MEDTYRKRKRKHGKRPVRKIMTVILLLLIAAAGVTAALTYERGPDLDKHAIAYQLPNGVKNTDPDSILMPGYDVLEMDLATKKVEVALLNPEGNDCYFKFHIILKSDGSTLYQTGLIKPGTAVTSFKIDKELKEGEYPIVLNVEAADMKDPDNLYNGGAIEAVLEVE
ncbi:hypothetical protein [Extibacter sp. GGCC_0201]|uniref:hypothetical protein n=1 Tax=Extibacter sp. GGCC_0201 TaxID=2731209 RepID=UPI001AA0E17B|nr:hypothetical protein [Extibacter sp. GGCC_0201]MBO1722676.1 hypothetical protein [Extibacter sp. GGCC_0201]